MSSGSISRRDLLTLAAAVTVTPSGRPQDSPQNSHQAAELDPHRRTRTVERQRVTQLSLESSRTYADAYNEVDLEFRVVGPDSVQFILPAYFEGNRRWSANFAGEELGEYELTSRCNVKGDLGLHHQIFQVTVTPYTGNNSLYRRGRLRVAPDKHYMVHRDGTPFLWIGDTCWMGLCDRIDVAGFARVLKDRAAKGFSVLQIVAGPFPETFPEANAFDPRNTNSGGFPFETNFARVNSDYFNAATSKLSAISEQGLVPCIVGMWGYYLPLIGLEKVKRFWRYLIARYSAYPVVWCIAGEVMNPGGTFVEKDAATLKAGWTEVTRFVRELDPYRNPITVHPAGPIGGHEEINDSRLMDFDMLQAGHGDIYTISKMIKGVREAVAREPKMPVVNAEVNYEGIFGFCWHPIIRLAFYHSLLNGAAGFTYGANGIWQVNQPGKPYGRSSPEKAAPEGRAYGSMAWDEAMNLPGSHHVGIGARVLATVPWWRMRPQPDWVESTDPSEDWMIEHQKENDPYGIVAAGIPRELRVIYVPMCWNAPTIKGLEPDVRYSACYIDPTTGGAIPLGQVKADREGRWRPSQPPPDAHDWLIVLRAWEVQPRDLISSRTINDQKIPT